MDANTTESNWTPPYATFAGLENFLQSLREHALPTQIDRSLMTSLSGSSQASLLSAMRSLNLVDESDQPTDFFKRLHKTTPESSDYKSIWKEILNSSYPFLQDGTLDINRATSKQLDDVLRSYGLGGSTVDKACAFFIGAAKVADIKISSLITLRKNPSPRKNGVPIKSRKKIDDISPDDFERSEEPAEDSIQFEIPILGKTPAKIRLPKNVTETEWNLIRTVIDAQAQYLLNNGSP